MNRTALPSTWTEAKRLGAKFFFPNKPCRHGNVSEWLTSACKCWCGSCKTRHSQNVNCWQKANADKVLPRVREWQAANPDRCLQHSRRFNEKARKGEARRSEGDIGKRMHRNALRRAAVRRATPEWADKSAIRAIYIEAGRRRAGGENVHVDHVIPLNGKTVSGLHVAENLRIVPADVNLRKHNKFVPPETPTTKSGDSKE